MAVSHSELDQRGGVAETCVRAHFVFLFMSAFGAGEQKALREEGEGPGWTRATLPILSALWHLRL